MAKRSRNWFWVGFAATALALLALLPQQIVSADDPPGAESLLGITPTPTFTLTPTPTSTPTPVPPSPPEKGEPVIVEKVDPVIVKLGDPEEALPGERVSFTIEVTNRGNAAAVDVVVTDEMPVYLEILSVEATQGTVSIDGQEITVDIGVVGPGFVVQILIQARIDPETPAPLVLENLATLTSANSPDQTASADVLVPETALPVTGRTVASGLAVAIAVVGLIAVLLFGFWEGIVSWRSGHTR